MKKIFLLMLAISGQAHSQIVFNKPGPNYIDTAIIGTGQIVQFRNGAYLIGRGSLQGGYIDASPDAQVFDTSFNAKPQGSVTGWYSINWDGASPNLSDESANLQASIYRCAKNNIPQIIFSARQYNIKKGIVFKNPNGGFLIGMRVEGSGFAYGSMPGTIISCSNPSSFIVGIQKVKGFMFKGFSLIGPNNGLGSYTNYQVQEDSSSTFLSNNCVDNRTAPQCGIGVDIFGTTKTIFKYPDFLVHYSETNQGGSTDIILDNVVTRFNVVGICLSPTGYLQNAEAITIQNFWSDHNKVAVSTGNTQERSVYIKNMKCWGQTKYIFDCVDYGSGNGCPPEVDGLNVAGGNRYLCNFSQWINKGLNITDAHIELLYSFGGCFLGTSGSLTIKDSWIDLSGSLTAGQVSSSRAVHAARCVYQGAVLNISNSIVFHYGASVSLPLVFNCQTGIFTNDYFDFIPIDYSRAEQMQFTNCVSQSGSFGTGMQIGGNQAVEIVSYRIPFITGMQYEYFSGIRRKQINNPRSLSPKISKEIVSVPLTSHLIFKSVDSINLIATFNMPITSNDYKILIVGDVLLTNLVNEFGVLSICPLGKITAIDSSGNIVLKGIPSKINQKGYEVSVYRNEFLLPAVIVGNVSSGNVKVTNAIAEGNTLIIPIGTPIYMPQFPLGTTVKSCSAGIITMSLPANYSDSNAVILSANWIGEEIGVLNINNGNKLGYKPGDKIYNNRQDIYPGIAYWLCEQSGVTGSAKLPKFKAY